MEDVIEVPRTDAVYNAHSYLTKVPVGAIIPFLVEYTKSGGTVVDMFAGSGMTAVAARMSGRNAIVSDISALGQHIGQGFLTTVDEDVFRKEAKALTLKSKEAVGHYYATVRGTDGKLVESIRTVWSFIYKCSKCAGQINYYEAMKAASWNSKKLNCPHCAHEFAKKGADFLGEEPVLVVVKGLDKKQVEQPLTSTDYTNIEATDMTDIFDRIPNYRIDEDREMYKRSALEKWGLTETRNFFSARNATILFDLWQRINEVKDSSIQKKLLFAFTAILPRASKRYQWSHKAPLNASNQNYYIAPVFYEWNVYDLFLRKIEASVKSDKFISKSLDNQVKTKQEYVICSADNLSHIQDDSVDYVFTDPPFGSNIFYADMNLFHEAWLHNKTENHNEAVIKTTGNKKDKEQSRETYKEILTNAFKQARRILKDGGCLSIVFGNSKGDIWSLAQSAFKDAGFIHRPVSISILDKGQRSVKGLNSGVENVATLDLIVTLKKEEGKVEFDVTEKSLYELIDDAVSWDHLPRRITVSHIYSSVLREAIYRNKCMADIDLKDVYSVVKARGYEPDPLTGELQGKK